MSASPKYTKQAILEVEHVHLLMSVPDALKVMEIMQRAVRLEHDFDNPLRMAWVERGAAHAELRMVRSDDPIKRMDVEVENGKRLKAPPKSP